MTVQRRDDNDTPLGAWIRHNPRLDSRIERLSICDNDFWVHQYRGHRDRVGVRAVDSIMFVEAKTFNADPSFAQSDTLGAVNQLVRGWRKVLISGEERTFRCFGSHFLQLSDDSPDTSDEIWWNRKLINPAILEELLRFERDPDYPSKRLEYRRHHLPSSYQSRTSLLPEGNRRLAKELIIRGKGCS